MSWLSAVVEIVKAIAWPIVVFLAVWRFRTEIIAFLSLIPKGKKFEVDMLGVKARIDVAEQQQSGQQNPAVEKIDITFSLDPSHRQAVNLIEQRLHAEIKALDSNKREAILVRALALSRMEAGHEFTYNRIFGSQILGLKRLNEMGRASIDDAREFFNPFAEQFPHIYANYGFDGWLGFLKNGGLIVQTNSFLKITEFGRDFLIYLTDRRLAENKPG